MLPGAELGCGRSQACLLGLPDATRRSAWEKWAHICTKALYKSTASVQKLLTTQVQMELLNFISQKMTMMILTSDYCFSSSLLQGTESACEAWKASVLGMKTLAQTCRLDFLGLGNMGGLDPLSQRPASASFGASPMAGQPQGYGA